MLRSFLNRIFAEGSSRGAIDGGIGARSKFRRNPRRVYLALLCLWGAVSAVFGHNLYISSTEVYFADDFLATMTSRASSHQSLIQVGDEFWLVQKGTPGPGTTLGVGGYLTFYVPTGYQVVDAAYVTPCSTSTDPRGFTTIPIKGQGPISVGSGKAENSALTTSELINYSYPTANVLGVRESPVTSAGLNRGTIAGVYADTGIFYSVSSRTAYTTSLAALGNKAGDSVVPLNLFDSDQERAFGLAQNAILNSTGGGNTPWGMGSAVAGPESGYAWCFDYAVYNATSGSATVKGQAATTVGPWNRIRYAGSQISKDIPGNTDTTIGYAGVSAGTIGYNFSTAGALPTTVNAVRFSVGQLQLGLPEYVAIKVKTTASFSSLNTIIGEALGGDAAGADTGKDNLWKYYNPTISTATPSALLQKKAANSLLATNGTTYFDLTFANAGTNALTNVVIKDTLPVGLGYVSSTPTAASTTGGVITWNLGVVSNGAVQTLKLNVRATNTLGILTNTVTASATGKTNLATAYDTVVVTNLAYLTLNKTVASPTVPPGGTNRYTVTVSNVGNVTNGIPLVITDSLPSGFSYVAFISASLNGTNYVATNSFISVSATNVAEPVFTINRAISPNQSCVITFDAKVASTNALGTYYNQAEMTYGSVSLPPTPLAPVTVQSNPVLSWSSISPLVYGVAITTSNALYPTSNVPGSFTFAPTNGSILPVGTNSLVANFTPSNTTSYSSGTITNTVVITKAILTTTCQPTNKVFGQTNPPLSYLLTGFVNGENSNSLTTQPVASTTVTLSTPVGVYTNAITASGGTASNYSFTYVPANFTVTKAVSTVAMSGTTSFTYGGSAQGPDSNTKTGSTGSVTYSYSGTGGTSYGPSATKPTVVGSYTATASLAADSNYEGATSTAYGFSIGAAPSTISVTGSTSFTYSGVSQGPGTSSKTGSSGAVSFSYSGTGGTSYGPSPTKPTAVGSYTATATLGADSNYNEAVSTPYSFSIGKAPSTINVTGLSSFTYNTNPQGPDSNTKTGSSGAVTYSYSGTGLTSYGPSPTKPTAVGSYEAMATLAADSNYEGATSSAYGFSIGKDGSTINVTGLSSFTYNTNPQGPDSNTKTGSSGAVTYSYSGTGLTSYGPSPTKPTAVGSYEATAALAADSNYEGATSSAYGFSIGKAPSTISVTGLSSFTYNTNTQGPDSNTKTGSSGAVTYSYSGTGLTSYGPSPTKPTDVGSYEATATLAADSNYEGATSTAYGFSIVKDGSTINVTGSTSFTYSGSSQGPDTSNKTGSSGAVTFSYSGTGLKSYGPSPTKPTDVGSYEATATLAADSNYEGATSSAYGFSIVKDGSTINVTGSTSFTYSGSSQGPDTSNKTGSSGAVTYSYSGTGLTSYGPSPTKPTDVGSYEATATLAADSNYEGATSSAYGFSIVKDGSTISVTGSTSFTYSGASQGPGTSSKTGSSGAVTYSYSGAGGTIYLASATKPTDVGSYEATASLAPDSNYNEAVSTPYSFSIGKAPSTISVTGLSSFTYSGSSQGPGTSNKTGSSGAVTYSYSGAGGTIYLASATKPTDVGSYEATATLAADSNYEGATSSAYGFSIGKDGSTISVTGFTSFTYSGSSLGPDSNTKTGSSGAVSYSYSGAGGTSYGPIGTKPTEVGSYEVTASLEPDSNYEGATSSAYGFTILDGVNPTANEDHLVPVPIKTSKFYVSEVLANDTDLRNRTLTITATSSSSLQGGTVVLKGLWILYTPPPGLASGVEDSFTYTLSNGVGSAQGTVYLLAVEWAMTDAMNILSVTDSAPGKVVTFSAIPNFVYEVFATSSLAPANWIKLGDYTADAQGILRVNDVAAGSSRFYRMRTQP